MADQASQATVAMPERYCELLASRCYAHVATVRPDGLLSVHPVALIFDGQTLRFSTLKSRGKFRNLCGDNRLSLSIIDTEQPLRHIELRGRASWEDDAERCFIDAIARKYFDRDKYPYDKPGAERITVTLYIEQIAGSF
jgi:PPOX class probable F420-dependent enzyme